MLSVLVTLLAGFSVISLAILLAAYLGFFGKFEPGPFLSVEPL